MEKEIEKRFEYVIKVNGKDVWHGLNPEEKFDEMVGKKFQWHGGHMKTYLAELEV